MKQKIYNITVCILAIISVSFAIIDFTKGLNKVEIWIDNFIYFLFILDYLIRFIKAPKKIDFTKKNIFDLIAIIPFSSAFRIFRILKFSKLLRLTKLLRVGSVSARLLTKAKKFLNTNGFKYVLLLSVSAILIASFAMMYFENMTFQDSLWWSFVTATTVGYGDLSPSTNAGRVIASLLMIVGIGLIGYLTSSITSFFLNDEHKNEFNSEKVDMVITLYNKLTKQEQEAFTHAILKNKQ